jgi:AraC family transcriptional regulator of adaptative response/methylated-DNA-[protein]-cysteine methyltransferase
MMSNDSSSGQKAFKAAQYIEQNSSETLSLEVLGKHCDISPFYLQRQFKKIFGISPKQFQNSIRIQRLKQSLKQGDDISGAIYEAGFGSTSRVYEQVKSNLGMTPSTYKQGGKNILITFALRETSLGHIIMAATKKGVCFVHFGDDHKTLIQALHQEFPLAELVSTPQEMDAELDHWMNKLEAHIVSNGPKPQLPLDLYGTAFQLKVWKFLTHVKEGSCVTYKDVAIGIDSPNAYRAAANACGSNNVAVLIPCHRVLRGDGQLGGYRWGTERKQYLLDAEQANSQS